jgi:hypothetical protein
MKKLLLMLGCFWMAPLAHAAPVPYYVTEVAQSSGTTNVVLASTISATQMDNPQLTGRTVIEVQNLDSSANLWCAPRSNVKSGLGRKIASGNSWILSFNFQTITGNPANPVIAPFHVYCISDAVKASSATVTQAY